MRKLSLATPGFEDMSFPQLEALFKGASSGGYCALEPLVCDPARFDTQTVKDLLEKHQLELLGLRSGLVAVRDKLVFSAPDKKVREKAVNRVEDIIVLAKRFDTYVELGMMQGSLYEGVDFGQAKEWVFECLKECAQLGEKNDVVLILEPVNRYISPFNNRVKEVKRIIEVINSKSLQILMDTFHMNIEEISISESILISKEYIKHIHITETNGEVPGTGHLDYRGVMDALDEIGYEGYMGIEFQKDWNLEKAKQASEYVGRILKERDYE